MARYEIDKSLELKHTEMESMVKQALKRVLHFVEGLNRQPSFDLEDASKLSRAQIEPLPDEAESFDAILELLFGKDSEGIPGLIDKGFNTAGPGYLAYIPGGGLFHSAVADLIANAVNRYVGVWLPAPGLVQLETNVVRWFCEIVGYPIDSLGFLTSGGSMANLSAVMTARSEKLPENFHTGSIFVSDQVHHSIQKAALLAGFSNSNITTVPTGSDYRINLRVLEQRITEDRQNGKIPFLLVASAGTTNTGAVDDLQALAAISQENDLWFHIDAAYGGFFMLTERGQRAMTGINLSDSMVLDPHKGLFLPYGTGCFLVRDREALTRTFQTSASYMPEMRREHDFVDFCEISPELSRDFRGLRIWLPIKMHGIEPFRRYLDEKLDLTHWAVEEMQTIPDLEIVSRPQLTVIPFRLFPQGFRLKELNLLNKAYLERINSRKRVFLNTTELEGRVILRICILSFRTHLDRMKLALEDLRLAAAEVTEEFRNGGLR